MNLPVWYIFIGCLLIFIAVTGSLLKRLPLTTSMFYLLAGFGLAPYLGLRPEPDQLRWANLIERLSEIAVIVSLFTTGLKIRTPLHAHRWRLALSLAFLSMSITVALIAAIGVFLLDLPLGAAVLLGAILAPTDPVLAADVQVEHPWDRDRLRFSLTAEAGLNDGSAFPFVMLGLGLLGLHEIGPYGLRWLLLDLCWASGAGLACGALLGRLTGQLVLLLRRNYRESTGRDDFLALGLIALSYGGALLLNGYGFLSVFAAGLALRGVEREHTGDRPAREIEKMIYTLPPEEAATDPDNAPAFMAEAARVFNQHLERMGEACMVLIVGALLSPAILLPAAIWFIPLLLLVVRPLAVLIGSLTSNVTWLQRVLIGWFGIRGVGSLYYLMFSIGRGLPHDLALFLSALTLLVIAVSIVLHGLSATPLMNIYNSRQAVRAG